MNKRVQTRQNLFAFVTKPETKEGRFHGSKWNIVNEMFQNRSRKVVSLGTL